MDKAAAYLLCGVVLVLFAVNAAYDFFLGSMRRHVTDRFDWWLTAVMCALMFVAGVFLLIAALTEPIP